MESSAGKTPDALLVAVDNCCALIRIQGRGSFKLSPALKDFCRSSVENKDRRLVLDMKDCVNMDSTFMGVLAGIALRLKHSGRGRIIMLNMSNQIRSLLETLGLDKVIASDKELDDSLRAKIAAVPEPSSMKTGKTDKKKLADMVLRAHEDLVELSPENILKFQDVLQYLRNGNQ